MTHSGLEAVFLANRQRLLGFLAAHGAGDAAEDLLQELWLRVSAAKAGPIAQPLSYLYRAANNLMLDRYRSVRQAAQRDADWTEAATTAPGRSDEPSGERRMISREQLEIAQATLDAPPRSSAATDSTGSPSAISHAKWASASAPWKAICGVPIGR
jgi:RNA polymerase sigma-70 factor (ECF subfamily)